MRLVVVVASDRYTARDAVRTARLAREAIQSAPR